MKSVPRSPPRRGFEVRNHPPKHILELYKSQKLKIHGTGFMINSNALKYLVRTRVVVYYGKYVCFQKSQREYGLRKFPRA